MKNNGLTTGNTGEWSELYALGFILVNGGIYGADKDQKKNEALFYEVLKVVFHEEKSKEKITYDIKGEVITIYSGSKEIGVINTAKLKNIVTRLFGELSSQNEGRAYSLVSGTEMMGILKKEIIKASNQDKNDLSLVLLDVKTRLPTPEIGFSIKSQLGSPSTLVNASRATNFIYEVLDANNNVPKTFPILDEKKIKENIELLLNMGYKIVFRKMENDVFKSNLLMIDSNLPDYLAKVLLGYFSRKGNSLADLVDNSFQKDLEGRQAIHKIKEFLSTMAMGMMPKKKWNGILTSLGGFLLVKKDGDVLCYYLYNLEDFREYLLKSTKLDTPSTTRHGFGKIVKEDERYYIKLNLQVRFTK